MCIVDTQGGVKCWNKGGEPNIQNNLGKVIKVSSGAEHTCALNDQGTVNCWGSNGSGQTKVPLSLGNVIEISAGYYHTCVLDDHGAVKCWGENVSGQSTVPANLGKILAISAGSGFTCAVDDKGKVTCWGSKYGQKSPPVNLGKVTKISAGGSHTCVINTKSVVKCWYFEDWDSTKSITTVPAGLGKAVQVQTGDSHTCVLNDQGTVVCWGWGEAEDLIKVPSGLGRVVEISSGEGGNCALNDQGAVICWAGDGVFAIPSNIGKVLGSAGEFGAGPSISGLSLAAGNSVVAVMGNWDPNLRFSYQWLRDGLVIPDATSQKYVLDSSDLGHKLSVTASGREILTSPDLEVPLSKFVRSPTPKIGGIPKVKQKLIAIPGVWDNGVFLSYQWLRNGKPIVGGTRDTYQLVGIDRGTKISIQVSGTKIGYTAKIKTSVSVMVK
jgi:alpha-tubulin suppressor-like RCC1 family protein